MVAHGRVELLSHEVSQKYLQMKWNGYGKYIHLSQLVFYLFFLTILTLYASSHVVSKSGYMPFERKGYANSTRYDSMPPLDLAANISEHHLNNTDGEPMDEEKLSQVW